MKKFLGTFAGVLILCWAFLFFGGAMIFENFWALLVCCALVITVLVLLLAGLSEEIAALERRIRALEQGENRKREEETQ